MRKHQVLNLRLQHYISNSIKKCFTYIDKFTGIGALGEADVGAMLFIEVVIVPWSKRMFNPAFVTAVWPKKKAGEVELFCGCLKTEEVARVGSWSKAEDVVTVGDCPNSDDVVTAAECSKRMSTFGTTSKVVDGFEAVMNEKKD